MSVLALPAVTRPRRVVDGGPDLAGIAQRYALLHRAMPWARVHYPVRIDPAPRVLTLLAELGACFEVATAGELEHCQALDIPAQRLSATLTEAHAGCMAHAQVPIVTVERPEQLAATPRHATVLVRLGADDPGHPPTRRPGCTLPEAESVLLRAARAGHRVGVAVSVGPTAQDVDAWGGPVRDAGWLARRLRGAGYELSALDLGGGLPTGPYSAPVSTYAALIRAAMAAYLGDRLPAAVLVSPGRFLRGEGRSRARHRHVWRWSRA